MRLKACGSLLIPHRETSRPVQTQGGMIPLYPTFFLEMPKTEYSGMYTFQVTVITSGRLKIEVTDLYCDASCLFEMNPNGDVRQRLDPVNTSAGFPEGDTIFAEYDLEAGTDYTLTMEYFQHTSLFGGSELQYFVIRSIPEGYDGPIRSMMNGIDQTGIDALSGTILLFVTEWAKTPIAPITHKSIS